MKPTRRINLFFLLVTFFMSPNLISLDSSLTQAPAIDTKSTGFSKDLTIPLVSQEAQKTTENKNKIIYMISPPRSLTSAFARMMHARGDFSVYDEPSVLAFNLLHTNNRKTFFLDWFKPNAPKTFDEFKTIIFNDLKKTNVFLKEMTFSVREFLHQDLEFVKDPRVHFVFLIRNPHDALISAYKKLPITQANLHLALPVVSYEPCFEIYQHLKKHALHKPSIVLTEDLYTNTSETVKKFCDAMQIPFIESSLTWNNLGDSFDGSAWHEYKKEEQMYHWHDNAIHSTGFHKPTSYAKDAQNLPSFKEITDSASRILCMQIYKENMKFYEKFLAEANASYPSR